MSDTRPVILWLRRDLRLADHPALTAAVARAGAGDPVFVLDEVAEAMGAARSFGWARGCGCSARRWRRRVAAGLRRGRALDVLRRLVAETGAGAVYWSRLYDPAARARDTEVKAALKADGVEARSFAGHLLFEPWEVLTGSGGFYRVFTPMWRGAGSRSGGGLACAGPGAVAGGLARVGPAGGLAAGGRDAAGGGGGRALHGRRRGGGAGAAGAVSGGRRVARYAEDRDLPAVAATSRLAGEPDAGRDWSAHGVGGGWRAHEEGKPGAETFVKELVWREFAHQLAFHTPHIVERNWKEDWDSFPWGGAIRQRPRRGGRGGRVSGLSMLRCARCM